VSVVGCPKSEEVNVTKILQEAGFLHGFVHAFCLHKKDMVVLFHTDLNNLYRKKTSQKAWKSLGLVWTLIFVATGWDSNLMKPWMFLLGNFLLGVVGGTSASRSYLKARIAVSQLLSEKSFLRKSFRRYMRNARKKTGN